MSDHHFHTITSRCLGCDLTMQELKDDRTDAMKGRRAKRDPRLDACPSLAKIIPDARYGHVLAIRAPDRLIVMNADGAVVLHLTSGVGNFLEFAGVQL